MILLPLYRAPEGPPHYGWTLDPPHADQEPDTWGWAEDGSEIAWSETDRVHMLRVPGRTAMIFAHEVLYLSEHVGLPFHGAPVDPPELDEA